MQQRYKRPRNQPRRNEQWAHLSSGKCSRLSHISIHADNFATCLKQRCLSCLFAAPPIPSLHPILPDPRLTSLLRCLSPPRSHSIFVFSILFSLCRWRWRQQAGDEGRTSNGHWRPNWWDSHSTLLWLGYDSRPPMHTELAKLCCRLIKWTLHSSPTSNVLLPTKPFYL